MLLQLSSSIRRSRRASRGFTLIELVTVVMIIGITAALATPTLVDQMRERRARDMAQRIAVLYSSARMRAMGRGSAVRVDYNDATGFTVTESILGATAAAAANNSSAACAARPGLGCLANTWGNPATVRQVETLNLNSDFAVNARDSAATLVSNMNICFTPMGRSFIAYTTAAPSAPMAVATTIDVQRVVGTTRTGLLRTVAIMPTGMARLGL